MWQWFGLQFDKQWVVAGLLLTGFFSASNSLAETVRRAETINGMQFTVEYRLNADGSLKVLPTHLLTTRGWMYLGDNSRFPVDTNNIKGNGTTVTVNGRTFSVRFSDSNGRTLGEAYAEWKMASGSTRRTPRSHPPRQVARVL